MGPARVETSIILLYTCVKKSKDKISSVGRNVCSRVRVKAGQTRRLVAPPASSHRPVEFTHTSIFRDILFC